MNQGESDIARFRALLEEARPPTGGVALEEIVEETAPVLPLLSELPPEERARGDYESFEFRECFTVLTLLGRRLALLDLTPTAAVGIVQLALLAIDGSRESLAGAFAQRAVAATVEGFVLGREEQVAQVAEARAAKTLKPLHIDHAMLALVVSGVHDPTVLTACVDALGREMLDAGLEIAIVDLSQLGEPNRERAAAMFAADEVAKMLGGVCFFTGVDTRWQAAAADARIPLGAMHIASNLAAAIAAAREMVRPTSGGVTPKWRALLDRLRR